MARRHDGPVRYIATAEPDDAEMELRIEQHRRSRPDDWTVVEAPIALGEAVAAAGDAELVIIDCVTLWVANLMADHDDETILGMIDEVVAAVVDRRRADLVVSNEVGSGLVPMDPVGRRFRDIQGLANQRFADVATQALLVVAGKTLELGTFDAG